MKEDTIFINRELSWLDFNRRVLVLGKDKNVPLAEQVKFLAIYGSNLDEFFMVRVGSLQERANLARSQKDKDKRENKTNMTAEEQLNAIMPKVAHLQEDCDKYYEKALENLDACGYKKVNFDAMDKEQERFWKKYFQNELFPILSPQIVDNRHPFPFLRNKEIYLGALLKEKEGQSLGMIPISSQMERLILVRREGKTEFALTEELVLHYASLIFGKDAVQEKCLFRVTRNADIDPDGEGVEEEEDYRQHMKRILKKRLRLQPVVLAVSGSLEKATLKTIRKALELSRRSVFTCDIPLDLGYVFGIEGKIPEHLRNELLFTPFKPQPNPNIDMTRSIREQVLQGDKLLFYPYEAMNPFLDLVHEAAYDPECISLRITLYRVAKSSHLCESLIAAAEAGKDTPYYSLYQKAVFAVMQGWAWVYSILLTVGVVCALFFHLTELFPWIRKKCTAQTVVPWLLLFGIFGMALLRCAMIAFVEVSSFGIGTSTMYLATVHPLLVLYAFAGLLLYGRPRKTDKRKENA